MTRFGAVNSLSRVEDSNINDQFSTKLVSTGPEHFKTRFIGYTAQENTDVNDKF